MKVYKLNSAFTFGKHSGKTILQVANEDMSYINWCLINLDHFVISDETIEEIQNSVSAFKLSELADNIRIQKINKIEVQVEDNDDYYEDDYGDSGEKYGWYNGWSDDVIDDAFEGDPMNTWNVD